MRGLRIQNIVNELAGEKIDVVEWSTDLRTYIANALSPAKVQSVLLDEESTVKTAVVVVPDRQLSLAIGKEGQNARLAAKLTGWRIDIKSESEAREEGLDLLAVHQTQRQTSGGGRDLLSLAERILQGDETAESISEERLRQAAETIQRLDAEREHEDVAEEMAAWPDSFKDLDDALRDRDESRAALDAFERAAAAIGTGESLKPLFDEDDVDLIEDEPAKQEPVQEAVARYIEPAFPDIVEEETTEEDQTTQETDVVEGEELPQIITADMLRQRMAQRRGQHVDFGPLDYIEVPEELLVGIDEEEEEDFEEWDGKRKGKRGVKPAVSKPAEKKKGKTAKRGKRREFDEEEFDDFSFR
jgi:N utilization substance protein A